MTNNDIDAISAEEVKAAVEWLWANRKNGGCYHKVAWTEDDTEPHPGRQWCFCIGWTNYGDDPGAEDDEYYCDEGYRIRAAIRYQNANNGMQSDLDWDFTIPELGSGAYDLSFDVNRGDFNNTAEYLNDYAAEMFDVIHEHGKEYAAHLGA